MLTFIRYIEVYFTFAFLDYARYNEDSVKLGFVISRFCSIHFIAIFAGLKKNVRYLEAIVIQSFVKLRFHCISYYRDKARSLQRTREALNHVRA